MSDTATTSERDLAIAAFFKALTEVVCACLPLVKKAVAEYKNR